MSSRKMSIAGSSSTDKLATSHRALAPGIINRSDSLLHRQHIVVFYTILCLIPCRLLLFTVLLLAQFFAVMPIYGISSPTAKGLRFTWFNLRVLHTFVILCGLLIIITLSVIWAVSSQLSISIIGESMLNVLKRSSGELSRSQKWQ